MSQLDQQATYRRLKSRDQVTVLGSAERLHARETYTYKMLSSLDMGAVLNLR
jgi:hypothetical protein